MLYDAPAKGDDGLYFVKARGDGNKKCLVQLNKVKVIDASGDIVFDVVSETNVAKVANIDASNLEAARENCETWFGKQLSENVITGAYVSTVVDGQISGECIEFTKVFNAQQEQIDLESIQAGKTCDVILEFAGLWFAKKSFGSSWNVVQVRVHSDPEPVLDTYPEDYAFVDDEE